MGEATGEGRTGELTADREPKSAEQLRDEIEDVRRDLGDTAAALAAKTDVKTRAQKRANELKLTATTKAKENPKPLAAAAGAFVFTLVAARVLSRRRR
jgi:hypothetical protein